MKPEFENWLRLKKSKISRPSKYSDTIRTISNHLETKSDTGFDIYSITNADEVLRIKDAYFSYDEYYQKNKRGKNMYSRSLDLYIEFLDSFSGIVNKTVNPEVGNIISDPTLDETEKESIILSRRGQGLYRRNVMKLWGKCSISGYPDVRILIASHIKPWKQSSNAEKVDKYNGLLLLPTYDKLFDLGYIGFDGDGRINISKHLANPSLLQLSDRVKIEVQKSHVKYLEFHLWNVFKS
jgi:hypothetical protein